VDTVIGVLIGLLRAGDGAEAVRLRTRLEDREARAGELQASLAEKERLLQEVTSEKSRLDGDRRVVEEKVKELQDLHGRLEQTFKVLAGETLKSNSESLIGLARREFERAVQPVTDTLKRYEDGLRAIEKSRTEAYGGLNAQLEAIARQYGVLETETGKLVTALRNPSVQGRWGELTLRRTAELAGMSEYCDFTEQVSTTGEGARLRPDMVVHLPGEREIVVDSKAPLSAYVDAVNSQTEAERRVKLKEHASKVREHVRALSGKDYASQFARAPEFTVLFLPGENFFAAAARQDPGLIEDAMKRGIIVATPTTLIALLLAVAHGWRQARLEENARQISEAGRELFDRMGKFVEHLRGLGVRLEQAGRSYNQAVGSFDTRLRPAAQRIKELGATGANDLPALPPIGEAIRRPVEPEGQPAREAD